MNLWSTVYAFKVERLITVLKFVLVILVQAKLQTLPKKPQKKNINVFFLSHAWENNSCYKIIDTCLVFPHCAGAEPQQRHFSGHDAGATGSGGGDGHHRGGPRDPDFPCFGGHFWWRDHTPHRNQGNTQKVINSVALDRDAKLVLDGRSQFGF